jgi:DNA-directed RNA polymerase specialized sigma24 family protein
MPEKLAATTGFQFHWEIALAKEWPTVRNAAASAGAGDDSDDCTQEVFLRLSAFPSRGAGQLATATTLLANPLQLRAYCWRTAVNYVYQAMRGQCKLPRQVPLGVSDDFGHTVEVPDPRPNIEQELIEKERKIESERPPTLLADQAVNVLERLLNGRGGNLGRILVEVGEGLGRCQSPTEALDWILNFTHSQETVGNGEPHVRRIDLAMRVLARMGDSEDLSTAERKRIRNRLDKANERLKESADALCREVFGSAPVCGRREYGAGA